MVGENLFNGEYLINAQGEDVVAGVRTPQQIMTEGSRRWAKLQGISEEERAAKYPSLEESMPECAKQLVDIQQKLEEHYHDMQDMEFTIQDGKLWLLQTRNGKRTGAAMVKIAMDLLREGAIDEKTVIKRMEPNKLDELLHPVFDKAAVKSAKVMAKGLPASPGAATGQIVFFADDAEEWASRGKKVIMVRLETSPEDLRGMSVAQGILTARGGMTSHAAVVARGMGKCCVSGAGEIKVDYKARTVEMGGKTYKEGDWISINGSTGEVYDGLVATVDADLSGDFAAVMNLAEKYSKMDVYTNADSPRDASVARKLGAHGIGLCRTEHMFFEGDRIKAMREMIIAPDEASRRVALAKLLPLQRGDFEGIFEAMDGYEVTIRLLDPPLFNPMLGHRGCRLGNTYPEITEMQARAIIEAALNVKAKGVDVHPKIMVPLIGVKNEIQMQADIINRVAQQVFAERGETVAYKVGTMIEIPRAALVADQIAEVVDFFSFGTNDLTQMTFGYSRDDAGKFLAIYKNLGILKVDPFQVLDQEGVGQLVEMACRKGRATKPELNLGICGEHGGEPSSVKFCASLNMNYVSCSPYRVPIARLAAAQAAVEAE